tara:strand:+ start:252 stop:539 length:288 start_codon:yes stop_codon:yes gene_type:complete
MKLSVIQKEIWLHIKELKLLRAYYDGEQEFKPLMVRNIENRLVQGILDKFLNEWDIDFCFEEYQNNQLKKLLEVKDRKVFDDDEMFDHNGVRTWE